MKTWDDMDRATRLKYVWSRTHKDYRGTTDGVKSVMILRDGGTRIVALDSLTDDEINWYARGHASKFDYNLEVA